ncbi:cytochrome P460 family protein [Pseudobacteriovorax antillogorgiicola]|uniref:Cytochrome P460 n=1 Tax=Pseudobacteriovorax antillogorgiicola TaxID=1513793 RepID=A0A1Y6BBH1_9BACT|nr:cytochrome P460 family protein [Pseudobacteriovorax antillogorgiicola]TCS57323.1 cytochrome P460 [Pseudobacteriovorax antillogorgiicola]SMF02524.1 Cytochrome P460 [Pseudobacteriovorax antillogorgiicola]
MKVLVILLSLTVLGGAVYGKMHKKAKLPKNFRFWTHTKSMVIPDKSHGLYGFHNIYANKKAYKTMIRSKKPYPNGAKFVVSFYDVVKKDGTTNQGKKLMDALMVKDSSAKDTGGWIFAAFDDKGAPKPINPKKDCFQCHADQAKNNDYVFHKYIK